MSYPDFLSPESVDLLKRLLTRKPSERISVYDALRHPWFLKNGMDIEKDEKAKKLQNELNITEAMKSGDRKLAPKILESDVILPPDESQMRPPPKTELRKNSSSNNVPGTNDTLELSQSIYLTDSQLQNLSGAKEVPHSPLNKSDGPGSLKKRASDQNKQQQVSSFGVDGSKDPEVGSERLTIAEKEAIRVARRDRCTAGFHERTSEPVGTARHRN